jgi:aerobic C4-dicarboxylate transport protein
VQRGIAPSLAFHPGPLYRRTHNKSGETGGTPMKKPLHQVLYVQVLAAIALGIVLGHFWPRFGVDVKPLGDGFIKVIRMIIGPVIFCTVVTGIAGVNDMKRVGRVGLKAIVYFEVVSTFALIIGLIIANTLRPGAGFNADPATLDTRAIANFTRQAQSQSAVDFLLNIIPSSPIDAFAKGDILQILFFSLLFGFGLAATGERGRVVTHLIEGLNKAIFRVVHIIVKVAPIGAFGAMAFTIGQYGIGSLQNLAYLIGSFYLTALLFVFLVLGTITHLAGFSVLRLIGYIKEELLIVLGTSSSEAALPPLMEKLEDAGCENAVVGLVVPAGYSFNLDGTNIYMTMAALFVAQATNTELTLAQELTILIVAMLTSKGATGVTGSGFITLAATMAVVPTIPVAGMALILGIDRFMSECRALTNFIGNAVATIVVAKWEKALDLPRLRRALGHPMAPHEAQEQWDGPQHIAWA